MTLLSTLYKHREKIIYAAFGIGGLYIFGALPGTVEFLSLGSNIKFVYLLVIVVGATAFNKFYKSEGTNIQREVPERILSSPEYRRDVSRQYGETPTPNIPTPQPTANTGTKEINKKQLWEFLDKEEH